MIAHPFMTSTQCINWARPSITHTLRGWIQQILCVGSSGVLTEWVCMHRFINSLHNNLKTAQVEDWLFTLI